MGEIIIFYHWQNLNLDEVNIFINRSTKIWVPKRSAYPIQNISIMHYNGRLCDSKPSKQGPVNGFCLVLATLTHTQSEIDC